MRTSGLPCRATPDCEVVFSPTDQKSMKSLLDAAAQRDSHELQVHGYTHRVSEITRPDFAAGPKPRRGRQPKEFVA